MTLLNMENEGRYTIAELADASAAALDDGPVGAALRAMHRQPAKAWSVAELAAIAGLSRAAFARRFAELVGEPPLTYLTNWRIKLARELLREPSITLAQVASEVGYANEYAFSAAFKRHAGDPPGRWRARQGAHRETNGAAN